MAAAAHRVVRMKPSAADVPYAVDRDCVSNWQFELAYAGLDEFMPLAQQMLLVSRLPAAEQEEVLEVGGGWGRPCWVWRACQGRLLGSVGHARSTCCQLLAACRLPDT